MDFSNSFNEYIDGVFKTDADLNVFGYSNTDVDSLATEANKNFKPAERKLLLEQLVSRIMADNPVVPLYSITDTFVIKDSFDFKIDYLADFSLETVSGRALKSSSN